MPKRDNGKRANSVPVESIRHKDKRKNTPTEELRDFVAEEENAPKTILYPRAPSLDPQLVRNGKDEQDRNDLAVDNHAGFGRWNFVEIDNPWDAMTTIRRSLEGKP